jgi:hypothetical protein
MGDNDYMSGAGSLDYTPSDGGTISAQPVLSCPYAAAPPLPPKKSVRASLFFDGTLNNRANTRDRLHQRSAASGQTGSFENDYSNVSRLEENLMPQDGVDVPVSIYIEGIGTVNHESDNNYGAGVGMGDTGVIAKVDAGLDRLIRRIQLEVPDRRISTIELDSFGFSRGAAAARFYVYRAMTDATTKLKTRLESRGFTVDSVTFKFVGIWDTVASYGTDHTNDTADLHLDAISIAQKVVHLASAEEHRTNFPLTDIASAGGNGKEIFLPGVHSDVGGGYTHNSSESDLQVFDYNTGVTGLSAAERAMMARERAWLVDTGWYLPGEVEPTNFWNEIKVNRTNISNRYSYIPLHLMARFARENGLAFYGSLDTRYAIPAGLAAMKTRIDDYIDCTARSRPDDWFLDTSADMKTLRNQYLHFSAYYDADTVGAALGTNDPHFTGDNPVTGRRQRLSYPG